MVYLELLHTILAAVYFSKLLLIQTAYIGDVILATAVAEKLHAYYPDAVIDLLVRQGNESLFNGHPFVRKVWIWDKKNKYADWWRLLWAIRAERYEVVINLQRYAATGLLTACSGAPHRIGFRKNPLSFLFTQAHEHRIGKGIHEINRNQELIAGLTNKAAARPRLYPTPADYAYVGKWQQSPYVCIAPAAVWWTKQLPAEQWLALMGKLPAELMVYLIGSQDDFWLCESIRKAAALRRVINLCGQLSLLQSAALMQGARMNFVNDSAPLHLASAMNAPVTVFFCSTVPEFGFGPLSDHAVVVQTTEQLACRPCGLHGRKSCPEGHFRCARSIDVTAAAAC